MKKYRGFTLIELLVVIAIIGILSAVVLASLNTARTKGNDVAVKANLGTVSTQAALYLSDNNSYGTFAVAACPAAGGTTLFGNTTVARAIAAALTNAGAGGTATCVSNGTGYAVSVSRPAEVATTTSAFWCVDSVGAKCGINSAATTPSCGTCATMQ